MMVALLACAQVLAGTGSLLAPLASMVELTLAPAAEPFYERAPVDLRLNVRNLTDKPLTVSLVLMPAGYEYTTFLYARPDEPFRVLTYTSEWENPGPHDPPVTTLALAPGGTKHVRLSLAADAGRGTFLFGQPGDYVVQFVTRATWKNPDDVVTTPPLRVHVEPAPRSEAGALADWDVDLAVFAQNDAGGATSTAPRFRRDVTRALRFIDRHPDSLYSRALRQRTLDTLALLRQAGRPLTEYEQDAFERLKRVVREEAQRDGALR